MWQVNEVHGRTAAMASSNDGWSIFILSLPRVNDGTIWLVIQKSEEESRDIDYHRAPFVLVGDEIILDGGDSSAMEELSLRLGVGEGQHYSGFDDHIEMRIWHGNSQEGPSPFLDRLAREKTITIEVFLKPYGRTRFDIDVSDAASTLRRIVR